MRRVLLYIAATFASFLWKLRYRVTFVGLEEVKKKLESENKGALILPNHPAVFIDPLLVMASLITSFDIRPMIVEYMYYNPLVNRFARLVRALPIPNFHTSFNGLKKKRGEMAFRKMSEGLKKGEKFIIYPSGSTKMGPREALGGAFGAYQLVSETPNITVVFVRMTGLWGSSFSRALTHGDPPDMNKMVRKAVWTLIKNCIFFTPKREVKVEFELAPQEIYQKKNKQEFNRFLEEWYNKPFQRDGENLGEPLSLVSYAFWKEDLLPIKPKAEESAELTNVPQLIKEQILTKVAELANLPVEKIQPSHQLIADLGFDSLELAELLAFLEDRFGVKSVRPGDLTSVSRLFLIAMKIFKTPEIKDKDWDVRYWHAPVDYKVKIPEGETLPEAFLRACDDRLFDSTIADPGVGVISYRKMKMRVLLLADRIRKLPGKRIGVLLPSSIGVQVIILACQLAGKTPVMINWTVGERHLLTVLETSKLEVVLTSWLFLDNLDNADIGPLSEKILLLEDLKDEISLWSVLKAEIASFYSTERLLKDPKYSHLESMETKKEAVILYTSGTEAMPKAVRLSHENILSNQRATIGGIDLRADDKMLSFLPPFHSFGFTMTGLLPIMAGVHVVYYPSPLESKRLAKAVARWGITILPGAPTFLKNIFQMSYREQMSTLRLVVAGAEKATSDFFDCVCKMCPQAKIVEGYGITECSPTLTVNAESLREYGVGKPLPSVSIKIVDPETLTPLACDETGLVLASGPNVFSGYLNSEKNPFVDVQGCRWYNTGDLGKLDADGNLILAGRLKRFVKVGGEMLSLAAVEDAISVLLTSKEQSGIEGPQITVSAFEEENNRARLILFTTVPFELQEVNNTLREQGLSNLAKIDKIYQVERIPVTATGKVSYRALDQLLVTGKK